MSLPLLNRTDTRRVAIFRALQLGDLLCAVPALRSLRAALPSAQITLIGLPWARSFVQRFSAYLDHFLEFPGYPGLPERRVEVAAFPAFLAEAHRRRFDLAIQMHGSGDTVNPIVELLRARHTAGYYLPGAYCPDTDRFLPYPEGEHEVRIHLRLMEFLGAPPRGEHLEFPLSSRDVIELAAVEEAAALPPAGYICLHPGARYPSRRWPVERFAAVGDALAEQGLAVVLTGSAEEHALGAAVARLMRAPALNMTGRTTLGAFAALLAGARLVVCNDTGASHVASALVTAPSASAPRWIAPS